MNLRNCCCNVSLNFEEKHSSARKIYFIFLDWFLTSCSLKERILPKRNILKYYFGVCKVEQCINGKISPIFCIDMISKLYLNTYLFFYNPPTMYEVELLIPDTVNCLRKQISCVYGIPTTYLRVCSEMWAAVYEISKHSTHQQVRDWVCIVCECPNVMQWIANHW